MKNSLMNPRFVVLLLALSLMVTGTASANGSFSFNGGLVGIDGTLSDLLVDSGLNVSIEAHRMAGNISIGAGLNFSPLSEVETANNIDSIAAVSAHLALRFYPITDTPGPRFFVGGVVGVGALGWEYINYTTDDSDGIGYYFFGPEGGVELYLTESFFFQGKARFQINSFQEETENDVMWVGIDGNDIEGNMFVIEAGIGVGF